MNLQSQVTSLELSKKLKELVFEQESLFYWWEDTDNRNRAYLLIDESKLHHTQIPECTYDVTDISDRDFLFRAYTVAEIGQMLWDIFEEKGWKLIYKVYGEVFNFKGTQWIGELGIINLMRNPDMGAKMLIYLKENNLLN